MVLLCELCHGNFSRPQEVVAKKVAEPDVTDTTTFWVCKVLDDIPTWAIHASAEERADPLFLSGEEVRSFDVDGLPVRYAHASDAIGKVLCGWHIHDDDSTLSSSSRFGVAVLAQMDEEVFSSLGDLFCLLGLEASLGTVTAGGKGAKPDEVSTTLAGARKNTVGVFCRRESLSRWLKNYRFYSGGSGSPSYLRSSFNHKRLAAASKASSSRAVNFAGCSSLVPFTTGVALAGMASEEESEGNGGFEGDYDSASATVTGSTANGDDDDDEAQEAERNILEAYETMKRRLVEMSNTEAENAKVLGAIRAMMEEMAKKNAMELMASETPVAQKVKADLENLRAAGYIRDIDDLDAPVVDHKEALKKLADFHVKEFPELMTQTVLEVVAKAWSDIPGEEKQKEIHDRPSSFASDLVEKSASLVGVGDRIAAVRASVAQASDVLRKARHEYRKEAASKLQKFYRKIKDDSLAQVEESLGLQQRLPRVNPCRFPSTSSGVAAATDDTNCEARGNGGASYPPKKVMNPTASPSSSASFIPPPSPSSSSSSFPRQRLLPVDEDIYEMMADFAKNRKRVLRRPPGQKGDDSDDAGGDSTLGHRKVRRIAEEVVSDQLRRFYSPSLGLQQQGPQPCSLPTFFASPQATHRNVTSPVLPVLPSQSGGQFPAVNSGSFFPLSSSMPANWPKNGLGSESGSVEKIPLQPPYWYVGGGHPNYSGIFSPFAVQPPGQLQQQLQHPQQRERQQDQGSQRQELETPQQPSTDDERIRRMVENCLAERSKVPLASEMRREGDTQSRAKGGTNEANTQGEDNALQERGKGEGDETLTKEGAYDGGGSEDRRLPVRASALQTLHCGSTEKRMPQRSSFQGPPLPSPAAKALEAMKLID